MIPKDKIALQDLWENGNKFYPDRIKFCIDRKQKTISIDEEMHIDMENELYDNGSSPQDIFGGDIVIDDYNSLKTHIVWEAHPNIERNRELGTGYGRPITDQTLIDELFQILTSWVI
ncbi:MAG: hypothetical protein IJ526_09455 [Lachnospiraceae bacterium]|nr:hypothetical protein [Lachnospiraceae bacterium]MBQ8667077.1 hypothetical protein [Lachnospiraceae bacterium]